MASPSSWRNPDVMRGAYEILPSASPSTVPLLQSPSPPPPPVTGTSRARNARQARLNVAKQSSGRRWRRLSMGWFVFMMLARCILFVVFVQGMLMQQRDVGSLWPRDKFFWAVVASLVMELPLHFICQKATALNPDGRRITAARQAGQVITHVFAFVAFFRTDTALFARSESAYSGTLLIIVIDTMMFREMKTIFDLYMAT